MIDAFQTRIILHLLQSYQLLRDRSIFSKCLSAKLWQRPNNYAKPFQLEKPPLNPHKQVLVFREDNTFEFRKLQVEKLSQTIHLRVVMGSK